MVQLRPQLGEFSSNINHAITQIRKYFTQIYFLSQQLSESNGELVNTLDESSKSFKIIDNKVSAFKDDMMTYSKEVSQLHSSFDKFAQISHESKDNASTIKQTVASIQDTLNSSMSVFNDVISLMNEINNIMNNISEDMVGLNDEMSAVNTVIDEVKQIASKTSLLSLNASIEAARAGDAGRGFSVVAQEIGKLATQSQGAVENIENTLTGVRKKTINMSESILENINHINEKSSHANQSIKPLFKISEKTMEASEKVDMILKDSEKTSDIQTNVISLSEEMLSQMENMIDFADELAYNIKKFSEQNQKLNLVLDNNNDKVYKIHDSIARYSNSVVLTDEMKDRINKSIQILDNIPNKDRYLDPKFNVQSRNNLKEYVKDNPWFDILCVLDANGISMVSNVDEEDGVFSFSTRDYFIEAVKGSNFKSNPYLSIDTYNYTVAISTPIKDAQGKIIGVFMGDVNLG